jgi:MYXO-CTERM domain-containing protein
MPFCRHLGAAILGLLVASHAVAETAYPRPAPEAWPDVGIEVQVSPEVRAERAVIIRDTAALAGLTNAVLIAGIGEVETNFAHCWSEATWACQGPASSSCDGGPVIAGAADGPCADEQGGLGMFQFDSGTYDQTIATYGPEIVTMSGNVEAVVPFLVERAIQSVEGVNSEEEALAWMNSIPIVDGNPLFEEWLYFVAWRYNGCQGCTAQQDKYRAGTHTLLAEFGAEFWMSSQEPPDPCAPVTREGAIIEEDDDCFDAMGPSEFWRSEQSGHGGALLWTKTTASENPGNYAIWNLRFEASGSYQLEVYSDGGEFGQSVQAMYEVTAQAGTFEVVIDQSSLDGWIDLGRYDFETGERYRVRLNDNTGEPLEEEPLGVKLSADALRVSPLDVDPEEGPPEREGGGGLFGSCSTSGSGGPWWIPLMGLLLLARTRRR